MINQVYKALRERRHVALLGPGGIGKSSLVKAILNERAVKEIFHTRRFFVTFDDILTTQITYSTFTDRIARSLGLTTDIHGISAFVSVENTLLVLDNAETILDTATSRDASRIRGAIDDLGGLPSVSILLTSRSRELPRGLRCAEFDVPTLDGRSACKAFMDIYQQEIPHSLGVLEGILSAVGHHPLTITLLAYVAKVNQWSIEELHEHWKVRRTRLLSAGRGKDENLTESIELSISTCVHAYGGDVRRVLGIIAFFPQGLPRGKLESVCPSIEQVRAIVDVLKRQSLLLSNNDGFVTMLVPIRLYCTDSLPAPDTTLLEAARNHYYNGVKSGPAEALLMAEDVNIESLVAYDLQNFSDARGLVRALEACASFLDRLRHCKPRPTCLGPMILAVNGSSSPNVNVAKMRAFHQLAHLAYRQSNYLEALESYKTTFDLAQVAGRKYDGLYAILRLAEARRMLGQFGAAKQVLEWVETTRSWKGATPHLKAYATLIWGTIKPCVDAETTGFSLAVLFEELQVLYKVTGNLPSADICGAQGAFAVALIDGNTADARTTLESTISALPAKWPSASHYFSHLAAVAFMERKFEESRQLLNLARGMLLEEKRITDANRILFALAVVTISEGKPGDATSLIAQAGEELKVQGVFSHEHRWLALYTSALVELGSWRLQEAYRAFEETKRYCEGQQEFHIRAFSTRGMGEVSYLKKEFGKAETHFGETVAICGDAGIVSGLLYRRNDLAFFNVALPAMYEGWPDFLRGSVPGGLMAV